MSSLRPFLALGALLLLPVSACAADEEGPPPAVIFLVRHAEKDAGTDPGLTEAGKDRATNLASLLADVELTGVFSTDTLRTRSTASPTARDHGLEVVLYDHAAPEALAEKLRGAGGSYLVVGHSNTVPGLVAAFGGEPGEPISDDEYTRLYVVLSHKRKAALSTTLLRY